MITLPTLRRVLAAAFLCLSIPALAAIQLTPVVSSGLSSPIFVGHAGDGSNRLFIDCGHALAAVSYAVDDTRLSTLPPYEFQP